ncbi:DNA polymerase beta superfamily protein [Flavobacterium cerinum]|uniref:Nucleotidyltransferase domain-containing protein n=1 Tax=Flavobacterium cerinum TaxID=2502784 RepID=A0ABY5J0Y4_9FLAO|nr:nucleotidyltransferase domain-containing protein [Flavobacterium cerinum]UUC47224.1 nucleotidyltransferase domain-containing protein [Flavobacterium cerinum]
MTIKEIKEKGLLLFECVSGSKAYGLDTPTSDTDIKGVFYLPKEQFFGLDYVAQVQNETNDEVYYELGRFVELLVKSNPGVLELLATPPEWVLYKHPVMVQLPLEMFLSKQAKDTFAGYAVTQIYKARGLKKKIVNPFPKERKEVTDFCFVLQDCNTVPLQEWLLENDLEPKRCGLVKLPHSKGIYAVYYDNSGVKGYRGIQKNKEANEVCLSSIPKGEKTVAYMSFNVESYSSYCKDYAAYWDWVAKRNEERYTVNQKHQGGYDSKNMMHTIRLLQVADEILLTGKLNVKRDNRDELLAIKAGEKKYEELLEMADRLIANIEKEDKKSSLKMFPDAVKAKEVLVTIREQLYNE